MTALESLKGQIAFKIIRNLTLYAMEWYCTYIDPDPLNNMICLNPLLPRVIDMVIGDRPDKHLL